ncbi:MAG: glucose 1-dehydrogenase [Limibacillus sp.]|jgi:NAD(P)-dependent dehydrogenase (short-subunit alcohol dehydrogenase family)
MDDHTAGKNRAVLVTGGSRGIGAAVSRLLAAEGWRVAVNYVSDEEAALRTVEAIHAAGGEALPFQADSADPEQVKQLFDEASAAFGPLSALVNNAGITGPVSRLDEADHYTLERAVRVNILGVFYCAQAFIRQASTRYGGKGGAMVNISSVAAELGSPGEYTWYAATKGAIDSFTIGLAKELAGEGIRVNAVSPGLIATEIHERESKAPERLERLQSAIPLGRAGEAEEVAEAVSWLLSDAASYCLGANIKVSGGR